MRVLRNPHLSLEQDYYIRQMSIQHSHPVSRKCVDSEILGWYLDDIQSKLRLRNPPRHPKLFTVKQKVMLPKQLESLFGTFKGCLAIWDWITLYNFRKKCVRSLSSNRRLVSNLKNLIICPSSWIIWPIRIWCEENNKFYFFKKKFCQ